MKLPRFLSTLKPRNRDHGWVAVSLGSQGVYLAQAVYVGGRPQILRCEFHPATEVNALLLGKVCAEAGLEAARYTTVLSASEYQMMMVEAPSVPVDELKTAIRWKIKDSLHYHIDDATIDVLQIPTPKYGNDRPQSLYAIAAANETIRKRIVLFEKSKLDLVVVDIPEMAQRNIAALYESEGRGLALLAFGEEGGLLTMTCDGELLLARRIDISIGQLQDADETLRQQYRDRVELEVQRSMDYFDRQFHHVQIERMLVSSPASLDMVPMLAENLGLPVVQLVLSEVMDIVGAPELADSEFASYALPALGAALRLEKKAL